ncbi:hypothetical protein [Bacillus sp. B-jedd]|uniref:hypothetical protein n=1 Tax=Bacillus sp. B-jedd TaxID=1476857 RepID=UPI000515644A|nr:hypothetical protein [Bacillus sp. B-jedd]CEG27231.1 hypothetical protein BN1002_02087 [Bacillus sp. B-jedd]
MGQVDVKYSVICPNLGMLGTTESHFSESLFQHDTAWDKLMLNTPFPVPISLGLGQLRAILVNHCPNLTQLGTS